MKANKPDSDAGTSLRESYEKQSLLYEKAILIAMRITTEEISAADAAPHLSELRETLNEIDQAARASLPNTADGNLDTERSRLSGLIEQLLALVNTAEAGFREARSRLLPQVGAEVTAKRMREAYQGAGR